MITSEVNETTLNEWRLIFKKYIDKLKPNRISGKELLEYLSTNYVLVQISEETTLNRIVDNIIMNDIFKEKLPDNTQPIPKAFFLENKNKGEKFYLKENKDPYDVWDREISRIFVGIDVVSGFFTVVGSTLLYDELNAVRGLDEKDLKNFVIVAQYILALKRLNILDTVIKE